MALSEEQKKHSFEVSVERYPMGIPSVWDHSSILDDGWAAPTPDGIVEEVPCTGWASHVPKEESTTNQSRYLGLRGPLEQPSSSVAAPGFAVATLTVTAIPVAAGTHRLARAMRILKF